MAIVEQADGVFDITGTQSAATLMDFNLESFVSKQKGKIRSISICNQDGSNAAVVSLILRDSSGSTNDIYIIKSVSIPVGVTLVLDGDVSFNNKYYSLLLTNSGGAPLSIIIR